MRRGSRFIGALGGLAALVACGESCAKGDLRGHVSPSADGGTYLAVEDDNGGGCEQIFIDQQPWPHQLHEPAPVVPGKHTISCENGGSISFIVKEGTTFRFDSWGP